MREKWAELVNTALAKANRPERVDHRSRKEQGLEGPTMRHLGPGATAMERRGIETELGNQNRETASLRAQALRLPMWREAVARQEAQIISLEAERERLLAEEQKTLTQKLHALQKAREEDGKGESRPAAFESAVAAVNSLQAELKSLRAEMKPPPQKLPAYGRWVAKQPLPSKTQHSLRDRNKLRQRAEDKLAAAKAKLHAEPMWKRALRFPVRKLLDVVKVATRELEIRKRAVTRGYSLIKKHQADLKIAYNTAQAQIQLQIDEAQRRKIQEMQLEKTLAKEQANLLKAAKAMENSTKEERMGLSIAAKHALKSHHEKRYQEKTAVTYIK